MRFSQTKPDFLRSQDNLLTGHGPIAASFAQEGQIQSCADIAKHLGKHRAKALECETAPDWNGTVPEGCDSYVHIHPECPHQAPDSPHQAEDWHVPHIVEHALPIQGQAVCVEAKIPIPPKVRAQNVLRVLLHMKTQYLDK